MPTTNCMVREGRADPGVAEIAAALAGARRVAIVRLGSIGDVVATIPLAWLLRDVLSPGANLAWLAHPESRPVLEALPAVDEVVAIPRATAWNAFSRWRAALAGKSFDVLLDLHGNLKSGAVARLAHARWRVGLHPSDCRERWNGWFMTHRLPRLASENKLLRALEVGRRLGGADGPARFDLRFPEAAHARARALLAELEPRRPVALLQLGRHGDVRSWPAARYAELARELARRGRTVVVTGGPTDRAAGDAVRAQFDGREAPRFEVGTLDLAEIGALFQELAASGDDALLVGPDGGCLHLAAACGLRVVGLFGPQDPDRTAPIAPRVTILHDRAAAPCVPCARRECSHPAGNVCMTSLTAADVVAALPVAGARATPRRETVAAADGREIPPSRRASQLIDIARFVASLVPLLLALLRDRHDLQLLVDATATGLIAFVTGSLARRFGSARTGLGATLCLLLMEGYAWPDRRGVLDAVATAGVALSLYLYMAAVHPRPGREREALGEPRMLAAAGAVGVALYVSGVAGLLLPLASLFFFEWFEHGARRRVAARPAFLSLAILAAALVARGLWLPADWPADHATTWAACGRFLLLGLLPASLGVPFALFDHFKQRRYREDLGLSNRAWRLPKTALFAALLLLPVPSCRTTTLALVGPLLALLLAAWIERRSAALRPSRP